MWPWLESNKLKFLLVPPKCPDYRHMPPQPVNNIVIGTKSLSNTGLCLPEKISLSVPSPCEGAPTRPCCSLLPYTGCPGKQQRESTSLSGFSFSTYFLPPPHFSYLLVDEDACLSISEKKGNGRGSFRYSLP